MAMNKNVDLVIVLDTSASMQPCIDGLRAHLREILKPMQGHVATVRFGIVGLSASKGKNGTLYRIATLAGGSASIDGLYSATNQYRYFTDDPDEVINRLDQLSISGDEDNLLALDIAMDHPFGPSTTHKRIIALFSDEKLETGIDGAKSAEKIPRLIEKLHARHIKLFCAMPFSDAALLLAQANGSEVEDIGDATGLASVDFRRLLSQIGKSISASTLQGSLEESFSPALYGQDKWNNTTEEFHKIDKT